MEVGVYWKNDIFEKF